MRLRGKLVAVLACSTACQGHPAELPVAKPTAVLPAVVVPPVWTDPPVRSMVTQVTNLFAAATAPASEAAAPWSLTASDGSGLLLARVDARAMVEGPLAFTELHLYFHNPEARLREGTFSITLPSGAAVSRFAMETAGELVEAEVVEKQLARRAYEDFLHRRQDPALLEKSAGNQFSARVFPIGPSADKHIVISFSQEGTPGHYALPLRGLPNIERVDVRVQVRGKDGALVEQTLSERTWKPDRDLIVDSRAGAPTAITAGELIATRIKLELPNAAEPPAGVTLLVDTSASRALGFAAEARRIHALVDELARSYGGALPVQVVAFDQVTAPIYDGRADGSADLERLLVQRGALGASDLGQALTWLGEHAPRARVVLVTDGVITAGANLDGLRATIAHLASRGVDRLDVVLGGGIRDDQTAAALTRAGLPHAGAVLDLDRGAPEIARRIGLAVRTELAVTAPGARWHFPHTIMAAQPGDEVTVYLRRDPRATQLAVTIGGATTQLTAVDVPPALLERAAAGAEIAELEGRLAKAAGDAATQLRAELVRRSVASRVVSSQTAMLILESDADYQRYGIDRTALTEILAIGPHGVDLPHRTTIAKRTHAAPVEANPDAGDQSGTAMALDEGRPAVRPRVRAAEPPSLLETLEVSAAHSDADRQAARAQLAALRQQQAELQQRLAMARSSAARAERLSAVRISTESLNNPLARDSDSSISGAGSPAGIAENRGPSLAGPLAEIEDALATGKVDVALARASAWHLEKPGDVLALIGLGDALEAKHDVATAARVYGSIIDLYPARADFRRFAGERLERLGAASRALIIDTYKRAVADRPDHLTGHRLLAYALLRNGQFADAFAAILAGIDQHYPDDRFHGGARVLAEDAGMIGAAYVARAPTKRAAVVAALTAHHARLATRASTRFVMYWETDANDVDFHIRDASGGHAWYSQPQLASGGELYADVTTGYGPECFAIAGTPKAGPYQLSINYFAQGPMGYGMGLLQIQKFDGKGTLTFEDRPYVIMTDHAFVDLGSYR